MHHDLKVRYARFVMMMTVTAAAAVANAQSYPSKPIRFLVGAPAGGGNDIIARIVGRRLAELLGQQVIIENRAGAGGNIAAEAVAHANPDGHTLFLFNTQTAIAPSIYPHLAYDPVKDFAPISLMASSPFLLVLNSESPVRSVRDLVALAKAQPGTLTYASGGSGSSTHLVAELFKMLAGVNITHIPYKGAGPAFVDLIAGQVTMYFASIPPALPHLRSGRLRAIAVTSMQRSKILPDLPTMAESGIANYEASVSYGVVTAARTPAAIIRRLNTEITKLLDETDIRERLTGGGADLVASTPSYFSRHIKDEVAKWARVVKISGAKAD